jgi:hypothetical protein
MKSFKSFILLSLFALLLNTSAFAQQTGGLRGQVYDSLGAVVVGATVIVVDAGNRERSVVTNQRGEFTVTGLAPGRYTVRVTATQFGLYENTEVEVVAGQQEELVVALTVEGINEVVDVQSDEQVSIDDNTASQTVLKGKDLESLPDDPDELAAALQALAGPSAGPGGGQIYIDGFTGGRMPPREAIREIRINQNPFSAEYERLGFGRIEILTRPGSDRFRGQGFFNFNDESMNSRNPFALNRAPSQMRAFGGNFSGPLKKGKSSYFMDISNRNTDNNTIINANILDQNFNIVPFRQDITVPTRRFSISPRLDYQINPNNTLIARYSFSSNKWENQGIGDFRLPTLATESSSNEHEFRLTETMIINPKTVNETRFEYSRNYRETSGDNSIPTINVSGAFTGGGSQVGLNYTRSNRFELQNFTTTSLGKTNQHSIKFGGRLRGVRIEDRSESGFGGTFTFAGVRDPFTGAILYSSIEQYRQRVLGNPDPIFNPTQFTITSGNPVASVSQYDVGLFITDDWRLRPDLTLSFGLRYENQSNISDNWNFAPRFSFAYSPGAGGARQPKTVFRGGAGIFYDRFNENFALQTVRFDGSNQIQYIVTTNMGLLGQPIFSLNGVTNVPTAEQVAAVAPGTATIRWIDDELRVPRTYQIALSVERQLPFRTTGAIFFVANRNANVLRTRNINAPVCGFTTICPGTTAGIQALRPDPTQGNIYQYEATGTLNQQQLIFNFNSRLHPRINFGGNYRVGFAKSDADGAGSFPMYSYDLSNEYGNSFMDVRHNFFLRASITMPWKIQMSPFIIASSGRPFNITTGLDSNRDSVFNERPTYAQLAAACTARGLSYSFCDIGGVSNPNNIIPRNYGRGPAFFAVNMSVNRTFGFGKSRNQVAAQQGGQPGAGAPGQGGNIPGRSGRGGGPGMGGGGRVMMGGFGGGGSDKPYNLTVGLQFNNLLNRTNLGTPIGNMSSDRFGQSISTAGGFGFFGGGGGGFFGGGNAANRRVELQLRFSF